MNRRYLVLGACALLCACDAGEKPRTQVMVIIDAQAQVRASTADVDLEIRSGSGPVSAWEVRLRRNITPGNAVSWPLEVALVPRGGDADRVFLAIATARDEDGNAIAQVRAISGYQVGKTLSLLLLFEDACVDKAELCDEQQTCRTGICVDAHVDPADLPAYERADGGAPVAVPFWDGGELGDAGVSGHGGSGGNGGGTGGGASGHGGSGGMDSGVDAGPDGSTPAACSDDGDCDDDDPCNGEERCASGRCRKGTAYECPALEQPCLRNVCFDDDGKPGCQAEDADEGDSCQSGDSSSDPETSCARDYQCVSGSCEPQTVEDCDPGQCRTAEGCDPDDGCVYDPKPSTTECDDDDPCTQGDTCSGSGSSCAGTAYSCDDTVACTVDVCDGVGGCTHTPDDGLCSGPCKSGTCDATMNCLNVTFSQDFTDCDDGKATTSTDVCYRGECVGGREGAPTGSCGVAGCSCGGFSAVRDLEYYGTSGTYVGLIDSSQSGAAPCTGGTVSIVYGVTQDALTPLASDTPYGAISEAGADLNVPYVISTAHIGSIDSTAQNVTWLGSALDTARAGKTIGSLRGMARHIEGSLVGTTYSDFWIWGADTGTSSTSRVIRCWSCSSVMLGGCSTPLSCDDATGYSNSYLAAVVPYTHRPSLSTIYDGVIELPNFTSAGSKRAIYEDGTSKDYFAGNSELTETDGAWGGGIKTSTTGQVLVFGSGTNNLRLCNDPSGTGDTTCTALTGLPNQAVRSYNRAALGYGNAALFMLANTGSSYYLLLLPVGLDPATGSNWREILLANSGTTAVAIAAGPSSFMILGKAGAAPFVWSWSP